MCGASLYLLIYQGNLYDAVIPYEDTLDNK